MYNITLFPNLFETFFKKFFNTLADSVLQGCIFSRETIKKRGRESTAPKHLTTLVSKHIIKN